MCMYVVYLIINLIFNNIIYTDLKYQTIMKHNVYYIMISL